MPDSGSERREIVGAEGHAGAGLEELRKTLEVLSGGKVPAALPGGMECRVEITELLYYLKDLHHFITCISQGDLSASLKYKGPVAGALKTLQANLRHMTWQTKAIADGDFSQRVDFMGEFSNSFNTMVDNLREARAQLVEKNEALQRLNLEMQQDLVLAREVQSATMNFLTDLPFLHSAVVFRPYAEVSGDFFDEYINATGDSLSLFIGDATGHGVSAALITMMVKMGLSSLARELKTDEVLRQLNRTLKPCLPIGRFLTGIFVRITSQGLVSSSNAGHPSMLIVTADGKEAVVFDQHGMPLGISSQEFLSYEEHSHTMKPGDRLFLYSDGVTECRKAKELYGLDRLISFLQKNSALELEPLLENLVGDLAAFSGEDRFRDDLTLLGFQYTGTGPSR
jgi:phosphoserine phosphatase RsbU/P